MGRSYQKSNGQNSKHALKAVDQSCRWHYFSQEVSHYIDAIITRKQHSRDSVPLT